MKMACPRMVRGARMPRSCAHCTGVLPCRFAISLNSFTLCAQCVVKRQVDALRGCREAVAQQLGACRYRSAPGNTMPDRRPLGCRAGLLDQLQRALEAARAGRLVPAVFELPAIVHVPARRSVAGGEEHAQPALRGEIDPALVIGRRDRRRW